MTPNARTEHQATVALMIALGVWATTTLCLWFFDLTGVLCTIIISLIMGLFSITALESWIAICNQTTEQALSDALQVRHREQTCPHCEQIVGLPGDTPQPSPATPGDTTCQTHRPRAGPACTTCRGS